MLFHNKLPITLLGQQWMDDDLPPDQWYWHWGTGITHDELPDDLERRWRRLLVWVALESYWDQCIRQPQVSHKEYQFVVDYLQSLANEMDLLVPAILAGLDFAFPLEYCEWTHVWSRYPDFIIDSFKRAGLQLNPTSPLDDERHPLYNEYASIREHRRQVQERMRVKDIVRVSGGEPSTSFTED